MSGNKKVAIITGILGQDGYYLARILLSKGYVVHGVVRPSSVLNANNCWRLTQILDQLNIIKYDILSGCDMSEMISLIQPDEVYHLASDLSTNVAFVEDLNTFNVNFLPTLNLVKAIVENRSTCKLYFAGSSLMFGNTTGSPQNEDYPMCPTTPYGVGKVSAHNFLRMYREAYGIFACTGILYNHESPLRDDRFLPRKISKAVSEIKLGLRDNLLLGDLEIRRDWSFAGDVVNSMWLMLQNDKPMDYVVGSGELHSIRDLLEVAFSYVGLDWREFVFTDPNLIRKIEYNNLCANIEKISNDLGWKPEKSFTQIVEEMVCTDLRRLNSTL